MGRWGKGDNVKEKNNKQTKREGKKKEKMDLTNFPWKLQIKKTKTLYNRVMVAWMETYVKPNIKENTHTVRGS